MFKRGNLLRMTGSTNLRHAIVRSLPLRRGFDTVLLDFLDDSCKLMHTCDKRKPAMYAETYLRRIAEVLL